MQKLWHVTYYYLATGMEGHADTADYGIIEAESAVQACKMVANRECRNTDNVDWMLSCLSAEQV